MERELSSITLVSEVAQFEGRDGMRIDEGEFERGFRGWEECG